jgi:hypothetical protein
MALLAAAVLRTIRPIGQPEPDQAVASYAMARS